MKEPIPPLTGLDAAPGGRGSAAAAAQRLRSGGTQWLLVGSLLAGIAAYGFQVVAARALGDVDYAPISSLWTLQYLGFTVLLYPVEAYIAREHSRRSGVASLGRLWVWVGAVACATAALAWLGRGRLLGGDASLAVVAGLIMAGYGPFAITRGRLAGRRRFRAYGLVTAGESMIRLGLVVAVALLGGTVRAVASIMPWGAAAAASAWPWLRKRFRQPRPVAASDVSTGPVRFLAISSVANAISQILLAAGPLVVAALHASAAEISVFFVTTTAARAPIVLAFGGVLSRLLPVFTRMSGSAKGDAALTRVAWQIVAATIGLAAVGAAAGAWIGDDVVALLFGATFSPPGWLVAGAVWAVVVIGGATVLNQVLIATGAERSMLVPWIVGLVAACSVLGPGWGSPSARVVAAMGTGAVFALGGLALAVRSGHRRRAAEDITATGPIASG